jgi:GntR family transcriptional regulator/MocR family aminotransferase
VAEWTPALFLDPRSRDPVYLQIAHALMKEIHRGRFRPGDPLPGYRTLAEQLGVSRNTVMSAYHELQVEGWVVSAPGEGSAVARRIPAHLPARLQSRNELPAPEVMASASRSGPSLRRRRRAASAGSWRWRAGFRIRVCFPARRSPVPIAGPC